MGQRIPSTSNGAIEQQHFSELAYRCAPSRIALVNMAIDQCGRDLKQEFLTLESACSTPQGLLLNSRGLLTSTGQTLAGPYLLALDQIVQGLFPYQLTARGKCLPAQCDNKATENTQDQERT